MHNLLKETQQLTELKREFITVMERQEQKDNSCEPRGQGHGELLLISLKTQELTTEWSSSL